MVNSAATKFEEKKEQYVTEIFIDTGDEDYITARWLFLNGLSRQFFWSAAQSLEKYLKAALLLNGHPVSLNDKKTVSSLEILFKNNITNSHALRSWVIENITIFDKELKKLQRR